jgi:hypothetical protein
MTLPPSPSPSQPSPSSPQQQHLDQQEHLLLTKLERKIAIVTGGFLDNVIKRLRNLELTKAPQSSSSTANIVGRQNIETICDYALAAIAEINPVLLHRKNQVEVLCYLSEFHNNQKLYSEMTRNDVLAYLDSLRKPEASDPEHKWIGTYNLRRAYFLRFFKWLYNPSLEPRQRPLPEAVTNINKLRRREQSTVKPSDLWTAEDDLLFLKYCPNKRDKAYHAIARDSSCRQSFQDCRWYFRYESLMAGNGYT